MTQFACAALTRRIERRLVSELALEPRALPPELALLQGSFRGRDVTLQARAYSGPRLAYARFVEVESTGLGLDRHVSPRVELDIGNVLALPATEFALPLLGVDLVEVGRDSALVVADLSPMTDDPRERAHESAVLGRHLPADLGSRRELPAWAFEWFSADALSVRVGPDQRDAAEAAVMAHVEAFIELARASRPEPDRCDRIARRQRAYSAAHRERDRGLLLLRRLFEPALADRFSSEILFPDRVQT